MSRWRSVVVALLGVTVSMAGVSLLLATNAELAGEGSAAEPSVKEGAPTRSERISPPGQPPSPGATRPPIRPLPSVRPERGLDPTAPPTFHVGGFPPLGGLEGAPQGEEEDGELQRQLASRRLAALERRVRAMNRRIRNMGDRGSTPEQLESQKERMEALLEEIRQKREEQGLGPFQIEEEEQPAN